MNKLILMGNVVRDPQVERKVKEDGEESVIARFDLAVPRKFKQDGEADADFFHCIAFDKRASFVEKYFTKGTRMLLEGRVRNNNYTNKNGEKVYGFNVVAEDVEFAQKKGSIDSEEE